MIDTLQSHTHADFRARYQGSFGFIKNGDGTRRLVQIDNVNGTQVTFTAGDSFTYFAKADSGFEFDFIPAVTGWYNSIDGGTYLLSRIPARQWHRGIHTANTRIQSAMGYTEELDYNILSKIFVEGFNNWQYTEGAFTCALSKFFALASKNTIKFLGRNVGVRDDDLLKLTDTSIMQELTDLVNRNKLPFKVIEA